MSSNHLLDSIKSFITPIHPAGYPFIAVFAIVSLVLGQIADPLGWIGIAITLWCVYFFRNPNRYTPQGDNLITSPADGRVQLIVDVVPPEELELGKTKLTRVSVFLNVFDVHVQRVPANGVITKTHYHEGLFLNASLDKASEENERQSITMKMENGKSIGFVQIAGLIARRIICNLKEEQSVAIGELYGLIRFGSRVDIYLPKGVKPLVAIGQRCTGGETIIADLDNAKAERTAIEMK